MEYVFNQHLNTFFDTPEGESSYGARRMEKGEVDKERRGGCIVGQRRGESKDYNR